MHEEDTPHSAFAAVSKQRELISLSHLPVSSPCNPVLVFSPSGRSDDYSASFSNETPTKEEWVWGEKATPYDEDQAFYSISPYADGRLKVQKAFPRSLSCASTGSIGNVLAYAECCPRDEQWRAEYAAIIAKLLQKAGRGLAARRSLATLESAAW